ncbi:MAG: hypothetical protein ACP5EN_13395 [Rhodovulum sp.]
MKDLTEAAFARLIAAVLVVGHVLLFLFGLIVAVSGYLDFMDIAQLGLMASPMLMATAVPAFEFVARGITDHGSDDDPKVVRSAAYLILFVILAFLAALFILYGYGLARAGLSPDQIKIGVGAVETALGGYLGIIRRRLFPDPPKGDGKDEAPPGQRG